MSWLIETFLSEGKFGPDHPASRNMKNITDFAKKKKDERDEIMRDVKHAEDRDNAIGSGNHDHNSKIYTAYKQDIEDAKQQDIKDKLNGNYTNGTDNEERLINRIDRERREKWARANDYAKKQKVIKLHSRVNDDSKDSELEHEKINRDNKCTINAIYNHQKKHAVGECSIIIDLLQ